MMFYKMIIALRQAFEGLTPNGSFCLPEISNLREHQCSKIDLIILELKRTKNLGIIVGNDALRTSRDKIAVVRD